MPRVKGVGRKRKAKSEPKEPKEPKLDESVTTVEGGSESEEEGEDWVAELLYGIVDSAVDEQRRVNGRFIKYAAMAGVCAKAIRTADGEREQNVFEVLHKQALEEMEATIEGGFDTPYCLQSPKYFCFTCRRSVAVCRCKRYCWDCHEDFGLWSWQGTCQCGCNPGQGDWREFDRDL